uniref:Transmembrane protein n=1 Tax=Tanacetum cinerariifolium TaxID=118510 RepID=A0A699ILW4_TANCI|nr:hypothetical protein [Tanacetum cinerariifolium]
MNKGKKGGGTKVVVIGSKVTTIVMVAVTGDDVGGTPALGRSIVVVAGFGYVCVSGCVRLTRMKRVGMMKRVGSKEYCVVFIYSNTQ